MGRKRTIESLPNELLYEIFKYFNTENLFDAFYGLNKRLNTIMFNHIWYSNGLFHSVSKKIFNTTCIEYLPVNKHRITSLQLSNNDQSPQQMECFFDYGFHLRDFPRLQSLELHYIYGNHRLTQITYELSQLHSLTKLNWYECFLPTNPNYQLKFMNQLWSLPKLSELNLHIEPEYKYSFVAPTIISFSIEHISITGVYYKAKTIANLLKTTPNIQSLSIEMTCTEQTQEFSMIVPTLNQLDIKVYSGNKRTIENFLRTLPNLQILKMEIINLTLNGDELEKIITNYLPTLKRFDFKMDDQFLEGCIIGLEVNKLLSTYQTSFWMDIQCYVRLDRFEKGKFFLYTLPYAFQDFPELPISSKSTTSHPFTTYDHVIHLSIQSGLSLNTFELKHRFQNIRHLSINCPIDSRILPFIPTLNYLNSLCLYWYDGQQFCGSFVQTILNRAPHLKSLSLLNSSSAKSQMLSFCYNSSSVVQLDLQPTGDWYDAKECTILSHSSLGMQCETLGIRVENRACIYDLVYAMKNLRSLIFRCRDDKWNEFIKSDKDELILWLKKHLPPTCTISRDTNAQSKNIRLWIR